jgi:hypothetical protein
MKNLTRQKILAANEYGIKNPESFVSYYTPTLQTAYNLGCSGIDLSSMPDVTGYRFGEAPECGLSTNYRDDVSERGLSLAAIGDDKPVGSTMFFAGRGRYEYSGILLPYEGSDGEPLILSYSAIDLE